MPASGSSGSSSSGSGSSTSSSSGSDSRSSDSSSSAPSGTSSPSSSPPRPDAQLASARQPSKSHHQQEAPSRGQSRAAPLQLADHGRDRARDSQHRSTDRDRARDSDRLRSGSQHRERQSTRQERLARGRQQTREPHRSADSNREHATSNRERDRQREREGAREGHANRQTGSRTERDIKKEGDRGQNRAPKKADPRPGPAARGEQAERAPVQQPAAQQRVATNGRPPKRTRFDEQQPPQPPQQPPQQQQQQQQQQHPAEAMKEAWGQPKPQEDAAQNGQQPKQEAQFGLSGALAAEANTTVKGVVLVHAEPPEARKPGLRWRLYVFKNGELQKDVLFLHRASSYLFGRERKVVDVATDHPSCSKQHAVLQYRLTEKDGPEGLSESAVRPYIMDLGSTNGTFLNNERIEAQRYYELIAQDMLKFGNSSREYVFIHDKSAEEPA